MRIFVSSSFEDLREHRAAAIRVLRQLGHEVLAMEDMITASAAPLAKVLEMVDRSEAYVGIFAWRYGYVPGRSADSSVVQPTPAFDRHSRCKVRPDVCHPLRFARSATATCR
jgi:hypothetical protein